MFSQFSITAKLFTIALSATSLLISLEALAQTNPIEFETVIAPEPIIEPIDMGVRGRNHFSGPILLSSCGMILPTVETKWSDFPLVMDFIGTRETWVPINGKPKKEYLFKVR